mmetsp:Transcript_60688/g.144649  ORF Transcript_60688/g.144649 Transcript_60688/m.144649 type:complete len:145 (-) Transcript_60688:44-478(-)
MGNAPAGNATGLDLHQHEESVETCSQCGASMVLRRKYVLQKVQPPCDACMGKGSTEAWRLFGSGEQTLCKQCDGSGLSPEVEEKAVAAWEEVNPHKCTYTREVAMRHTITTAGDVHRCAMDVWNCASCQGCCGPCKRAVPTFCC